MTEGNYNKWLMSVDEALQEIYGNGKESLPKIVNFRDMFGRNLNAEDAAREALRQCGLSTESFKHFLA